MDLRIHEQSLPGIGRRYELSLGSDRSLIVVVHRDGRRHLAVRPVASDEATPVVDLTQEQAMALAALLTGARFSIDEEEPPIGLPSVAVETVTLSERSPAIGRTLREISLTGGADAAILAIIRDDTPQLVEHEDTEPCRPGDRLVLAAQSDRLPAISQELAG